MRITRPNLRALAVCLAGAGFLATGAAAAEPIGEQFRVSNQQPDGNASFDATSSAVAHNSVADQYLTVWEGETATDGESEVFARISGQDGAPIGAPFRVSDMGPDGNAGFDAFNPDVTYNPTTNEYLVSWHGDDNTGALIDGEFEVYVQRISASGAQIGGDSRVSDMGPDGNAAYDATASTVAYNSTANEYLVTWTGDDNAAPLVDGESEIFVQRLSADGAQIGGDSRISDMGPDGDSAYDAFSPTVAYNSTSNEYMVAWNGDDNTGGLVQGEVETYVQRLSGTAAQIGGDTRVSDMGPDGDTAYGAFSPVIAYNSEANQYLVAWYGDDDTAPLVNDEREVFVQRVDAGGAEIGGDTRVSDMGPDGDTAYRTFFPAVAYNSAANEYLVTWSGADNTAALVTEEFEVFAQRISSDGEQIAGDTRISNMGPDGNADYDALHPAFIDGPAIAYNSTANEYLVAWEGDDNTAPLVDNEYEVYARRVKGGVAPGEPPVGTPPGGGIPGTDGAPSAANCAEVPVVTGGGASGTISLTSTQLKINQRIGQAAVRRANAIDGWLNDGLVNDDLCGGSLVGDQLDPGVSYATGPLQAVPAKADPRPISIPPATPKTGVTFEVTAEQLQINQKVYSAAVRRANALKARIEGELTGGDIRDAELTKDRLRQDLALGALAPAASIASASTTKVEPATVKSVVFTPTLKQLGINQKIAQAAVKRTNELRALLGSGLKGENFADGSISAADWAP